jgi:hypothetical protein
LLGAAPATAGNAKSPAAERRMAADFIEFSQQMAGALRHDAGREAIFEPLTL